MSPLSPIPTASHGNRENSVLTAGCAQVWPMRVKMLLHVALRSQLGKRRVAAQARIEAFAGEAAFEPPFENAVRGRKHA
jgi:hypothetical protein